MLDRSYPDRPHASTTQLADGSTYVIRASRPEDHDLLLRCFAALSPRSRRLRFFIEKAALTPEDLERLSQVDGKDHIAFVAIRVDDRGRELEPLGFARCQRLSPGGAVAELSMVTVDRVQGMGVGSALLSRLILAAQRQGIDRFWFEVLMENNGMRRLAQKSIPRPNGRMTAPWSTTASWPTPCPSPSPRPARIRHRSPHPPDRSPAATGPGTWTLSSGWNPGPRPGGPTWPLI